MAGVLRLELRRTVLETAMLPLHHTPISFAGIIIPRTAAHVNTHFAARAFSGMIDPSFCVFTHFASILPQVSFFCVLRGAAAFDIITEQPNGKRQKFIYY